MAVNPSDSHRSLLCALLVVGTTLGLHPPSVTGGTLALDFMGGAADWCAPVTAPSSPCTAGWDFVVNTAVTVDGLAFWDEGSDGLVFSHQVGIFDGFGVLLTSETVDNLSTPLPSTADGGRWLLENIDPITLAPGNYLIGAFYPDGRFTFDDPWRRNAIASTIPQITYTRNRIGSTPSGLAVPGVSPAVFEQGLFGPTFTVQDTTPIPEPSTLLLFGTGVAILRARSRPTR